jgi:outer membrane receptor protein involved in Fe transport
MTHRSKTFLSGAAMAAGVIVCGQAWAQNAPANQTAAAQSSDEGAEIVVTANRRSETVQNVGGGITALGQGDLERMHANSFNDFATSVPGLSFQSNSPTNNLIAIRGVASSTAELGSAVAVYLDDVPVGASTQFGLGSQSFNFGLWDMDRVEVLNGPQGTLYGANALGGAIKYITTRPKLDTYEGAVETDMSGTDHAGLNVAAKAMLNLSLGSTLAIRLDGIRSMDSGWANDPGLHRNHLGTANTTGGRVSLLWQPIPDLEVRLTAFSQKIHADGLNVGFYSIANSKAVAGPYSQQFVLNQPSYSSVDMYSGTLSYDLHFAKLISVSAYQRNHGVYQSDDSVFYGAVIPLYTAAYNALFGSGNVPPSPYDLYVDTRTKKFTQEVRLQSPSNHKFEWVAGAYYTHENTDEEVNLLYSAGENGKMPAPYSSAPFTSFLPSTYKEVAGFADVTGYIGDIFDLTLGVRYSHQDQVYSSNIWWLGFGPSLVNGQIVYGNQTPNSSKSNQGVTTFLINPRLHLSKDVMLYGRVSSGFRPGGPNFFLADSGLPSAFNPDKLWNYEIGEKGSFFNHRLTFDIDGYDIEWKEIQTTQNVNGINQLVNAGNARIRGAEVMAALKLTPALTLNGSGSYTDAKLITTAPVLGVNYSGARLPLSPRWNFAVGATYRFTAFGNAHGSATLTDVWVGNRTSGYAGSATNILYKLPAYNTVNANVNLALANGIEFGGFIRNLLNSKGQLSAITLNNTVDPAAPVPVTMAQPFTAGVSVKVSWGGR